METVEDRLARELGQLIVQLHVKNFQLDQANEQIKELRAKFDQVGQAAKVQSIRQPDEIKKSVEEKK